MSLLNLTICTFFAKRAPLGHLHSYKAIKAGKVYAAHVDIVDPDEVYLYIAL